MRARAMLQAEKVPVFVFVRQRVGGGTPRLSVFGWLCLVSGSFPSEQQGARSSANFRLLVRDCQLLIHRRGGDGGGGGGAWNKGGIWNKNKHAFKNVQKKHWSVIKWLVSSGEKHFEKYHCTHQAVSLQSYWKTNCKFAFGSLDFVKQNMKTNTRSKRMTTQCFKCHNHCPDFL